MKKNRLGRIFIAALSFSLLLLSANVSAQRGGGHFGGGHPSYHFGGGAHVGGGYYAPRASYHYVSPGYGATRIYHPTYSLIAHKGASYGYYNGMFYRPYGYGLHLIFPPIGIRVGVLPLGYYPFYWGADPYFYYGGIFYNPYTDGGYQVVTPPLGALVPELPAGVQTQVINGQEFYVYYGTFYQKEVHANGEVWFKVVGRNGKLETGNPQYDQQYQPVTPPSSTQPDQQTPAPVAGDLLNKLPDGCTAVNIGGEQYFKAPDGTYYQEVIGQDNKVMYQMVDKSTLPKQ
jgi:hypothetical protein